MISTLRVVKNKRGSNSVESVLRPQYGEFDAVQYNCRTLVHSNFPLAEFRFKVGCGHTTFILAKKKEKTIGVCLFPVINHIVRYNLWELVHRMEQLSIYLFFPSSRRTC